MRGRWLVVVVAVAGCRQLAGLDDPLDDDGGTGSPVCHGGGGLLEICLADPVDDLDLSGTIDTDSSPLCATDVTSGGTGVCVVAGHAISIAQNATVDGDGSRPLVLVSLTTITIAGTLDAASHRFGESSSNRGPGFDFAGCTQLARPGSQGGGGGGSFIGLGGAGGDPGPNPAGATMAADTLHGGCPGADGGPSNGGRNGVGGGAVYLIADGAIEIGGTINASGSSGAAPEDNSVGGGGGGGSGGMIGLAAPDVTIGGTVFANGGGGGEGGASGSQASSGKDPSQGGPGTGGSGGAGGDGGDGAGGATLVGGAGGAGTAGTIGGGGGGGGAGAIRVFGSLTNTGVVSPPPS